MDREELLELARDRDLATSEMHEANDFYGHAGTIKRHLGIPEDRSLRCVVVHGPMYPTLHWQADLNAELPVLLTSGEASCGVLRSMTDKLVFAVGPVLAYAECRPGQRELEREKVRLGKNLLVFPPHSTHHIDAWFDAEQMCADLAKIGRGHDSVTVCMYWKDVLRGLDEPFRAAGFHCRTAGHIYDTHFLDRLKTLLHLSDTVVSYSWTSALGYAVYMGKPVMALHAPSERFVGAAEVIERDTIGCDKAQDSLGYRARVFELFRELRMPTAEQREAIDFMWGLSDVKRREELAAIVELAGDMFALREELRLEAFPDFLLMGSRYAEAGRPEMASLVLEQALRMGYRSPELLLQAARMRLAAGDGDGALLFARDCSREYPGSGAEAAALMRTASAGRS